MQPFPYSWTYLHFIGYTYKSSVTRYFGSCTPTSWISTVQSVVPYGRLSLSLILTGNSKHSKHFASAPAFVLDAKVDNVGSVWTGSHWPVKWSLVFLEQWVLFLASCANNYVLFVLFCFLLATSAENTRPELIESSLMMQIKQKFRAGVCMKHTCPHTHVGRNLPPAPPPHPLHTSLPHNTLPPTPHTECKCKITIVLHLSQNEIKVQHTQSAKENFPLCATKKRSVSLRADRKACQDSVFWCSWAFYSIGIYLSPSLCLSVSVCLSVCLCLSLSVCLSLSIYIWRLDGSVA